MELRLGRRPKQKAFQPIIDLERRLIPLPRIVNIIDNSNILTSATYPLTTQNTLIPRRRSRTSTLEHRQHPSPSQCCPHHQRRRRSAQPPHPPSAPSPPPPPLPNMANNTKDEPWPQSKTPLQPPTPAASKTKTASSPTSTATTAQTCSPR